MDGVAHGSRRVIGKVIFPQPRPREALRNVRTELESVGWNFARDTKVLMLTHRALATEMGYGSMRSVFTFNDSFTRKANEVIAYFHEHP